MARFATIGRRGFEHVIDAWSQNEPRAGITDGEPLRIRHANLEIVGAWHDQNRRPLVLQGVDRIVSQL